MQLIMSHFIWMILWHDNKNSIKELNTISNISTGMPLITFLLPELREISPNSKLSESYKSRKNFFKENNLIYFNLREILFESSAGNPSSLWVSLNDSHTNALANDIITNYMKSKLTRFLKKKCNDKI